MSNTLKNTCFVFIIGFLGILCMVLGYAMIHRANRSLSPEELALALEVNYWDLDLQGASGQTLYMEAIKDHQVLLSQRIGEIEHFLGEKNMLFLRQGADGYHLSIVTGKDSRITWTINSDILRSGLCSYPARGSMVRMEQLFMKGSDFEIVNDFSQLYDNEIGLRLVVK